METLQVASEANACAAERTEGSAALYEHASICRNAAEHAEDEIAWVQELKNALLVCRPCPNHAHSLRLSQHCMLTGSCVCMMCYCTNSESQ
jgi:hypothetical protein